MSTERVLRALTGREAAHVLALWGLVSLLPDARLRFDEEDTPVLDWDGDDGALCETAARGLVERTWGLGEGPLRDIKSTVPERSLANRVSREEWAAACESGRLPRGGASAAFNLAATSETKVHDGDLKVRAAALTLLSGRSHTTKTVEDTWGLLGVCDAEGAQASVRHQVAHLLRGELLTAAGKPGLRFSASVAAPRAVSGSELCDVQPLIDLLALTGQMLLSPAQAPCDPSARGKAFAWVLNPVPLDLDGLLDLSAAPPASLRWTRFEAPVVQAEGAAKVSVLLPAHPVTTDPTGGSHHD